MNIPYLITLMQNKLNYLSNARASAAAVGDVAAVGAIEQDMLTTQNTLAQLELLQQVATSAAASNMSAADLISSAIESNAPTIQTQGPSASAVINGYDISAYATDAQYEGKITAILNKMPTSFGSAAEIDTYIQGIAPGSPVTGLMVTRAAGQYNIDIMLLMAIMELDSQFGTQGVGARTNNPGNVGNTGTAERTFASWDEGVAAVAAWLSTHRVSANTNTTDTTTTGNTSTTSIPLSSATPAALAAAAAQSTGTSTDVTATTTPPITATTSTDSAAATTTPDTTATAATTTTATSTSTASSAQTDTSSTASSTSSGDTSAATSTAATTDDATYATTSPATSN